MDKDIRDELLEMIEKFSGKRVLVLGDAIVDEFVYGEFLGRSLSSPETRKLKHKETKYFMGGAGNVVKNLLGLGAKVSFITVVGEDSFADHYKNWKHPNLKLCLLTEKERQTIVKRRFCEGKKRLLAIEHFDNRDILEETEDKAIEVVKNEMNQNDVIIFQDQGHGFFSKSFLNKLKSLIIETSHKVLVNSQTYLYEPNHLSYEGFHTIFMNLLEAKALDENFKPGGDGKTLTDKLGSSVCVTLGSEGALIFKNGERYYSRAIPAKVLDTCGAGDAFLSAFAVSDFELNPELSLRLANVWAGLSAEKEGTEVPRVDELKEYIKMGFFKETQI